MEDDTVNGGDDGLHRGGVSDERISLDGADMHIMLALWWTCKAHPRAMVGSTF